MPNFKPNPNGMKPSGFKMKGWGGYQGSPVKKGLGDLKLVKDLKEAGKQIKEDFGKGGKVYKEIKEDVKKLKNKLGFKEKGSEKRKSDISTVEDGENNDANVSDLVKVGGNVPVIGDDWKSGTGDDPWEYKKIDGGYQTRKGPNGDIINITDPKSKAYQAIGEKIFDTEPETYGGNTDLESTIPEDVLFHNPGITYKEYMAGDYHLGNPKNPWRQKHEE